MTTLLALLVLLAGPEDACAPVGSGDTLAHFSAFAPVFEGGVVMRATGARAGLETAFAAAGLQGTRILSCPKGALLVWVPGATEQAAESLAKKGGLQVLETVRFAALEGREWLLSQCVDARRCEALVSQVNAEGLCGFTLAALNVAVTKGSLVQCRALAPEAVACALREAKACRRTFQAAMAAKSP